MPRKPILELCLLVCLLSFYKVHFSMDETITHEDLCLHGAEVLKWQCGTILRALWERRIGCCVVQCLEFWGEGAPGLGIWTAQGNHYSFGINKGQISVPGFLYKNGEAIYALFIPWGLQVTNTEACKQRDWREGSVTNVFADQVQGTEFWSLEPMQKQKPKTVHCSMCL